MTLDEAIEKAKNTVQPASSFEIPFDMAETAKSYVGRKFRAGEKSIGIVAWQGQNYVMTVNGEYGISPVMHFVHGIEIKKIVEA